MIESIFILKGIVNYMKEYRIAKCLDNGKINNYAIFKDGS